MRQLMSHVAEWNDYYWLMRAIVVRELDWSWWFVYPFTARSMLSAHALPRVNDAWCYCVHHSYDCLSLSEYEVCVCMCVQTCVCNMHVEPVIVPTVDADCNTLIGNKRKWNRLMEVLTCSIQLIVVLVYSYAVYIVSWQTCLNSTSVIRGSRHY